jgi:predicted transcriptional regulator
MVLAASRYELWDQVGANCGVDWDGYAAYFEGAELGYAIEVYRPRRIQPVGLGFSDPMSWRYLNRTDPAHARLLAADNV